MYHNPNDLGLMILIRIIPKERNLNPQTYTQIHTATVVQGGGRWGFEGTPPHSFWYVAVFRNDLRSVESFRSSQQCKVYFLGVCAAGGL